MYLDSSNIAKLLVQEPDSALFQDVLTGQALETSALCDEKLAAGEIARLPLEDPTYLRAAADRLGIPVFPETLS